VGEGVVALTGGGALAGAGALPVAIIVGGVVKVEDGAGEGMAVAVSEGTAVGVGECLGEGVPVGFPLNERADS
jgi:hypothetical protein